MSAFDITGAVVWTPSALICWVGFFRAAVKGYFEDEASIWAFFFCIGMSLPSAYCIARLFGAHT